MSKYDSNLPIVAVIIPCHNHSDTLLRAMRSIAEQTYQNVSMFVSDEGSSDNTWDILTNYLNYDEPVEIIDEYFCTGKMNGRRVYAFKNLVGDGPSAARNRLIKSAWESSDLFSMLDADDYYLPTKIEKTVSAMSQDFNLIGLVYNDAIIKNEKTGIETYEYREPYSRIRLEKECITSNTPLISKKALQEVGLYDEDMRTAEDWDLALRITSRFSAIHIAEALHVYSVTGQNSSDTVSKEIWQQNWIRISQKIEQQKRNVT